MFPLFSGLLAGAVCVLAPDHLAPVLSLSFTDVHDFRSAFRVGWQWGIGHSSGIFFVLMMVLALKVTVTHYMFEMFVFWSQVFVGGVLIGLGLHYWANQAKYLNQKLEEARDGAAAGSPGHNMINCACCFPPTQSGLGRNIFSARKSRMSPSDSVTDGSSPTASSPPSIRFFGPDSNPPSAIDEEVDDDLDFSCEACTDDELGGDEGADDERSPVAGTSSTFGKFSLKANLFQAPPNSTEAPVMDVESYYKRKKPGGNAADVAAPASSTKTSTHPVTDTEGGSTTAASGTEDADEADPAVLELACEAIDDAHFNKNGAISFSGATGMGFSFAGAAQHARPSALKPIASSPSPANTATTVASPLQQAPAASSPLQPPASSPTAFSGKKLPKSSPRYSRTKYAISFGTPSPPPFGQFAPLSVEEPEKVAHQSVGEQKLVLGEKQEGPILVLAEAPPLPQQHGPAAVSRLRGSATVLGVNTSFENLPGSGVDEYDSILDLGSAEAFGGFCSVNFLFPPCCLIGARRMRSSACAGAFSHSIRMRFGRLYRWLSFLSTSFNKEDGTKIEDSKLLLILGFVQGFSCPSNLMSMLFLAKQLSWFEILCFMASYCFSSCCLMGCFCYVLKVWLFRGDDLAAAMSTAVEDVNTVVENALGNTVGNAKKSDDTSAREEPQELQEVVGGGAVIGSSRNISTSSPPSGNGGFLTNGVVRNRAELGVDGGAIPSGSSTNKSSSSDKKKPEGRCSRERIYRLGCLFLMLTGGLFIFESVVGVDVFDCLGLHEHHHAAHHDGHHNHETDDDKDVTWDDVMEASGNMGPEMSGRISWPQETSQEPHVGDSGGLPHRHGDTDQHVENAAEGEGSAVVAPPTPAGSKDHSTHEGVDVDLGTRAGGGSSLRSRRSDNTATGGGGAGAGVKAASSGEKVGGPPPEVLQGGAARQERSPFRDSAAGVLDATGGRAGTPGSPGGAPERKETVAVELEPGTATREQQQNNWAAREPPHPRTGTGARGTHDEQRPSRFPPRKSATAAAVSSSSATPAARPTTKVEKSTRERDRGNMYGGVNGPPIRSTGDVAYDLEHQNTDGYRSADSASSNLQKSLPGGGGKGYNFEQAAASNPFEAVAVAERVYSAPARYIAAREIEEEDQFVEASSGPANSDDFFVAQEDASAPLPHEDAFIVPRRPDPLPSAPPASAIADMVNARPSRLRSERAPAPMGLIELGPVSSGRTTMPSLVRRSRENGAATGGSGGGGPGKSPFLRTSTGRSGAGPGNYIDSLRGHQSHGQRQPQLQQRQPENSISRAPALQLPSDEAAVEGGGVAEIVRRLRAHQGQTTTSQDYYVRDVDLDVDVDMEAVTIEPKMSEITNTGTGGILTTDLRQWTF